MTLAPPRFGSFPCPHHAGNSNRPIELVDRFPERLSEGRDGAES